MSDNDGAAVVDNEDTTFPKPEKRPKLSSAQQQQQQQQQQQKSLRKFTKIPIFIVECHNDVLEFVYKCFASRHLPIENNTLIHFDSHPDMVISRDIKASCVYKKTELLSQLSIENWIMPGCYAGHFKEIIWIKNSWCDQIPSGIHKFMIGERDDIIHVNLPIDYFISEGNFCEEKYLRNSKEICLQVIDNDLRTMMPIIDQIQCNDHNLILDIDLDFFSTANPFLQIYENADCYKKLTELFSYNENHSHEMICENRKRQLLYLNDVFDYLERNRTLRDYDNSAIPDEQYKKLQDFVSTMQICYDDDDIDWKLIKDAGCTSDHNGLPHHISTDDELNLYFENFEEFLKKLPQLPVIVTISRSSEDDYCPKDQVDMIQKEVLSILNRVFDDKIMKEPILAYEDENWDVMKL